MLAVATGLLPTTPAIAELKPGLALDARAAISSNPLLLFGPDEGAAVADVSISPSLEISDDTGSSIELGGMLSGRQYSRLYGNLVYGNAHLSGTWRNNERLSVLATAAFDRAPLIDRLTSDIDASVNSRGVRESWSGQISAVWRPDAYTWIQPDLRTETGRYPGAIVLRETRATTAAMSATRRTSPRMTLGARVSFIENAVEAAPDSSVFAAYAIVEQRMSTSWRLRAELGFEHSNSGGALGATPSSREKRTQAAGRMELCRQSPRLRWCASGELASEVSGLGSLQRRFELSTSALWRLSERVDLAFEADYQRASQQDSDLPALDAAQAFVRLDRRLGRAMTLSAIAEYRYREPLAGGSIGASMFGIELKYQWTPR